MDDYINITNSGRVLLLASPRKCKKKKYWSACTEKVLGLLRNFRNYMYFFCVIPEKEMGSRLCI
jgi:hypothetical protein